MKQSNKSIPWSGMSNINANQQVLTNMRPVGSGTLAAVGNPQITTYLASGDTLAGCDLRGNTLHIFVLREGNLLYLGHTVEGEDFYFNETSLDKMESVSGFASVGDFVVISTHAGMRFLRYTDGEYTYLGGTIEFPVFAAGTAASMVLSQTVMGRSLECNYTKWSGTLLPDDFANLTKSVKTAIAAIKKEAKAQSSCINPITIRIALRLFDDSLIWSDQLPIAGSRFVVPEALANVDMVNVGSYAVNDFQLTVPAWKPSLTLLSPGIGKWRDLVKAVEVYASEEYDIVGEPTFRCESTQTGESKYYLRVSADDSAATTAKADMTATNKFFLIKSISDIDAFVDGKITDLSLVPNDASGSLSESSYVVDATRYGEAVSMTPFRVPYSAEVVSTVGNQCFAGNLVTMLPGAPSMLSLANPAHFEAAYTSAEVVVLVKTSKGLDQVINSSIVSHWSSRLASLITYPDARATKMIVTATLRGKMYRSEILLTPSAMGNYAFAQQDGGFIMQETSLNMFFAGSSCREVSESALWMTDNSNPLVWSKCDKALNRGVRAVVPSLGYGSSWLLGRHSAYLFATEGIYLLSFNKLGCSGATLVSLRQVADQNSVTLIANGVAFVDTAGNVCRLKGSTESTTGIVVHDATAIGYSAAFNEILVDDGTRIITICADNTYYFRAFRAARLVNISSATFLTDSLNIHTVEAETDSVVDICIRSPEYTLEPRRRLRHIAWSIIGDSVKADVAVTLSNGRSNARKYVTRLSCTGTTVQPLFHKLIAPYAITYRLSIEGKMRSNTIVRPPTAAIVAY